MTTEEAVVRVAKVAGGAVGGNEGGRKGHRVRIVKTLRDIFFYVSNV